MLAPPKGHTNSLISLDDHSHPLFSWEELFHFAKRVANKENRTPYGWLCPPPRAPWRLAGLFLALTGACQFGHGFGGFTANNSIHSCNGGSEASVRGGN